VSKTGDPVPAIFLSIEKRATKLKIERRRCNMKPSIRIIKRRRAGDSNESKRFEGEKSAERSEREMARTVKGWIAELQHRKLAEPRSFQSLPVIITASGRNP
jgi:hypothetical protein